MGGEKGVPDWPELHPHAATALKDAHNWWAELLQEVTPYGSEHGYDEQRRQHEQNCRRISASCDDEFVNGVSDTTSSGSGTHRRAWVPPPRAGRWSWMPSRTTRARRSWRCS